MCTGSFYCNCKSAYVEDHATSWILKVFQAANVGMPSVTYPRTTWRLQAQQEAVLVCEKEE